MAMNKQLMQLGGLALAAAMTAPCAMAGSLPNLPATVGSVGTSASAALSGSAAASANASLVSTVGAQAQQATAQLSAQTAIRSQDQSTRDSASGVNLDEEAASLMQFQQAYQAAAQVISTSNTLFQSLLSALHG